MELKQTPKKLLFGKQKTFLKNEDELSKILNTMQDVVTLLDAKTHQIIYSNKTLLNLLGYSETEIHKLGDDWFIKLIHKKDLTFVMNHAKSYQFLHKDQRARIVYRLKDPHNEWRFIESTDSALTVNNEGFATTVITISRLVKDGNSYNLPHEHDSKQEYRCHNCKKLLGIENVLTATLEVKCIRCGEFNILSSKNISKLFFGEKQVFITDHNGRVVFISKAFEKMTGLTNEEVLGKSPLIWNAKASKTFLKTIENKLFVEKTHTLVKTKHKKKNGETYDVVVQLSPVLDERGNVAYIIGIEVEK